MVMATVLPQPQSSISLFGILYTAHWVLVAIVRT